MLSGQAPFQASTNHSSSSADAIMARIMDGKVAFSQPEWEGVSQRAKECIKGETVNWYTYEEFQNALKVTAKMYQYLTLCMFTCVAIVIDIHIVTTMYSLYS